MRHGDERLRGRNAARPGSPALGPASRAASPHGSWGSSRPAGDGLRREGHYANRQNFAQRERGKANSQRLLIRACLPVLLSIRGWEAEMLWQGLQFQPTGTLPAIT